MAQYPINLPQLIGTTFSGSDGIEVERSISGRPRIRNYYSQTWREGKIIHELSDAQLLELNNFYTANKAVSFTFLFKLMMLITTAIFLLPLLQFLFLVDFMMFKSP